MRSASATAQSFSTVQPEEAVATLTYPLGDFIGTGPLKVKPPLECSMLYSGPPGSESSPTLPDSISKRGVVQACFIGTSMAPNKAPSVGMKPFKLGPSSTKAMFTWILRLRALSTTALGMTVSNSNDNSTLAVFIFWSFRKFRSQLESDG